MGVRTGEEYLSGIRGDSREVWLRGEKVKDVSAEVAFRNPIQHVARIYDMQHDPAFLDDLTYVSPTSGKRVATSFMPAKTMADVKKRARAFRLTAETTLGMMGRTPDFMNTTLLAFEEAEDLFAKANPEFAKRIKAYCEYVRENDLFLTHAIITPQNNRAASSANQADEYLHLGVVRETSEGLIVRGARMLATMGPMVDEVIVYNLPGVKPEDVKYAPTFALPIDTPGIRQICREPFNTANRDPFDHPLATNFEEPDTLIYFDDVLVPWDRVFAYNDIELANKLFLQSHTRNYAAHQTSIRGLVKLEFAVGIAIALAKAVGADQFLHVQEMLGECINYVEIVRSCIDRAESCSELTANGTLRPLLEPLQTVRTFMPRCYPRVIEVIQTIGAGGLLMMPSAEDFRSDMAPDIQKYYGGANGLGAEDRVRLFKLAWDLCGDAFGSRQLQYERYYGGDPVRTTAATYLTYKNPEPRRLVDLGLKLGGPVNRSPFLTESSRPKTVIKSKERATL